MYWLVLNTLPTLILTALMYYFMNHIFTILNIAAYSATPITTVISCMIKSGINISSPPLFGFFYFPDDDVSFIFAGMFFF